VTINGGTFAFTANQTMDAGLWSGARVTNEGSVASWALTVLGAIKGTHFKAQRIASFQLAIDPSGTELFRGQSAGFELRLLTDNTVAEIWCDEDGIWDFRVYKGNAFGVLSTDYSFAA
jgi:hypothetical protein